MRTSLPFVALCLTALYLIPSGAHLFELPGKMALEREAYLAVQSIYRGWALFGVVVVGAIAADAALALAARRRHPAAFPWAAAGLLLLLAALAVFFVWVFPANRATGDWSRAPEDWASLRRQWEYGHALAAAATAASFCCIARAALAWRA